jgi:hypothetical protein
MWVYNKNIAHVFCTRHFLLEPINSNTYVVNLRAGIEHIEHIEHICHLCNTATL